MAAIEGLVIAPKQACAYVNTRKRRFVFYFKKSLAFSAQQVYTV